MTSTQRAGPPSASWRRAGPLRARDFERPHAGLPVAAGDRDPVHRDAVEGRLVSVCGDVLGQHPLDAVRERLATDPKYRQMLENQPFGFGDFCHLWFHSQPR